MPGRCYLERWRISKPREVRCVGVPMFVVLEFFGYFLIEYLLTIPGGIIRWAYLRATGKKVSLEYCLKKRIAINYGITLAIFVAIGVVNILS